MAYKLEKYFLASRNETRGSLKVVNQLNSAIIKMTEKYIEIYLPFFFSLSVGVLG